jgi:hypothetical protein
MPGFFEDPPTAAVLSEGIDCEPREFIIRQHDQTPPLVLSLTDYTGVPLDLDGWDDATFTLCTLDPRMVMIDRAVADIDVIDGTLTYIWQASDTDFIGEYEAEFDVLDAEGKRRTFPADGHIRVQVLDDLDDA